MALELVESPLRSEGIRVGEATPDDKQLEPSLRPKCLDEYIGQPPVVNNLRIFLKAALRRTAAFDHVLLFGPPGSARRALHLSSRTNWVRASKRRMRRRSKKPATLPRY